MYTTSRSFILHDITFYPGLDVDNFVMGSDGEHYDMGLKFYRLLFLIGVKFDGL